MARDRIHIRLFIMIPVIFTGITVLGVILSYRITDHYLRLNEDPVPAVLVLLAVTGALTAACAVVLTRIILRPLTEFVSRAEDLIAVPAAGIAEQSARNQDELAHFSYVFDQVTSILTNVEAREHFPHIIGESRVMRGLFSQILQAAPTDATILITGESGTGKELFATSAHEHSRRRERPFMKINCAAIPAGLIESELFGHERGSFTGAVAQKKGKFELADGGTLFLDEIGDMPADTQAKILRVIQEKEFQRVGGTKTLKADVRFIVATNRNLPEMVKAGRFREDLFHRLNVFSIRIPALRERREDIPLLVEFFLGRAGRTAELSPATLQLLIGYDWPGNVRELENALERAAILAEHGMIEPEHLPGSIRGVVGKPTMAPDGENRSLDESLEALEKAMLADALRRSRGVQKRAAELLGIKERSFWHRVKKYGIDVTSYRA
jgi:transcriptional regulator with PAS, ATPase and Fis domain